MSIKDVDKIIDKATQGINEYLNSSLQAGKIDKQQYNTSRQAIFPKLDSWLRNESIDAISRNLREGIVEAINRQDWEKLTNAFRQSVRFGTGGIRGMMAFDKESIIKLKNEGIDAAILKGPNTINDLVMLLTSAGVAKFGKKQNPPFSKIVIGYDSRIRGYDFAAIVARLFLAYNYNVYLFDAPCPYPEMTFAIPYKSIKADVGVLISASHNDYRYNGYKLSCSNGSQFDPAERDQMYNDFIKNAKPDDIPELPEFKDVPNDKLWFLGGDSPVEGFDYAGKEANIINMHKMHRDHVISFILTDNLAEKQAKSKDPLKIAFCPFHGAGQIAVPRLLKEVGFKHIKPVNGNLNNMGLNELNGLFPAFCSDPGKEQQPDPGDPRAAKVALKALQEDYPDKADDFDILIGTDPDADRCGIVVKVPENQVHIYDNQKFYLLPADDAWTLLLWYRFQKELNSDGSVKDADKKFVTLSHTTTDSITLLARKYGIGVIKSWVGFAALAASTRDTWDGKIRQLAKLREGRDDKYVDVCHPFVSDCYDMDNGKRSFNMGALEQSNGFSILGGPPPDKNSLGENGHVRDKDGTFAALLIAEIAAWAKDRGSSLIQLLDQYIYTDPEVGLFATFYEPDPLDGEYPGIEGDKIKKLILRRALGYYQLALTGDLEIAGMRIKDASIYRTGKYDVLYPPSHDFVFPDEGVRLFLEDDKLSHITIRPSGTGNSLRFHIQLHTYPTADNLLTEKERLRARGRAIMDELRVMLKAPR